MSKRNLLVLVFLFGMVGYSSAQSSNGSSAAVAEFKGGLTLGFYGGTGIHASCMVSNFALDFPLSARFGIGYAGVDPGKPAEARRIFINNATNGIPEESGRLWDFRLDLLYPVKILSLKRAYAFAGPRYGRFTANFKFIGGNEDFDVKSNQWGVGGGLESYFQMTRRIDLVLTGGLDYYPASTLAGHDTSYSPDDENVNAREDYTYDDADNAIQQPKVELRLMFGLSYRF